MKTLTFFGTIPLEKPEGHEKLDEFKELLCSNRIVGMTLKMKLQDTSQSYTFFSTLNLNCRHSFEYEDFVVAVLKR